MPTKTPKAGIYWNDLFPFLEFFFLCGGAGGQAVVLRTVGAHIVEREFGTRVGTDILVRPWANAVRPYGVGASPFCLRKFARSLGRAWIFSENGHPFVCFADISPDRGITRPYGLRFTVGFVWIFAERQQRSFPTGCVSPLGLCGFLRA